MHVNALIFTHVMRHDYAYSKGLGAYRVATSIRDAGYTCQVIDLFTEFTGNEIDKIIDSCISMETLIVGFSTTYFMHANHELTTTKGDITDNKNNWQQKYTPSYPYSNDTMALLLSKIRAINPKVKIVVGGSKAVNLIGECDAYAVGYCDQAIVEYMKYIEGKNPFFQYDVINDKQIVFYGDKFTSKFEFTSSTVNWHKTDYVMPGETLPIEISRGCIFKCKFCAYPLNGKKKLDFIKSADVIKDEFLKNYYEYGVTRYIYCDDTHNDSIEKLERLHKVVNSLPFEIEYAAYLRHDLIHAHKETAQLLKESGIRSAIFGIETLNHESGKAIGKGLHPEKTKDMLNWLKQDVWKNDVAMSSGFIVGLPHDSPDTINSWSAWLFDKSCPLDAFHFEPLYISNIESSARIWTSEFEKSSDKFGYKFDSAGQWENEHYTFATAARHAAQLVRYGINIDRFKCAGFPLIMFANLGLVPKDLIGTSRTAMYRRVRTLNNAYIEQYKQNILQNL